MFNHIRPRFGVSTVLDKLLSDVMNKSSCVPSHEFLCRCASVTSGLFPTALLKEILAPLVFVYIVVIIFFQCFKLVQLTVSCCRILTTAAFCGWNTCFTSTVVHVMPIFQSICFVVYPE